ncbi:MAG TPA: efflux RND transporter periplasmic adaptor subunit [Casimicrobiaceae bacterium]|nr:efflux RND transporter periplasmic adaptor subunit [Casimicrobiaceae bacterium]
MTRPQRVLIVAALALIAIGAGAWLWREPSGSQGSRAAHRPDPAVPVTAAAVVRKTVPVRLRAIGNIEPYTTVAIKARVDGQIDAVRFSEGDEVVKGATLFELDRRPFEAQLAQAQATLLKDRATLDNAREQEKRYKDLLQKKFISPDAYGQVRTNAETAAAQVGADEAAIQGIRLQIDYCTIRAPITGYAGKIMIQQGNLVKANDTNALVVINQVRPIYASFSVPEQDLDAVRRYEADGELQVTAALPKSTHPPLAGKVTFIDNTTDVTTGTIKLRAEFPNADKALWPGQFVDVVLTLTQQKDAVVMPANAVQNGPDGQYVFVVKPDHSVELRNVKIARTEGDDAVVASGVVPGDTVVTTGQLRLAPGIRVKLDTGKSA